MAAGVVEAAVACSGQSVRKSTGTPPRAERGAGAGDPPDTATREAAANRIIHVHRGTRVQKERADRLLLHLFQHQIHHRGQAHAMLSGTSAPPPQLDVFFSVAEAPLR